MNGVARLRRSEQGFTITEVMVAMLLLAVALMGVMGSLDASGESTLTAQRNEQAVSIAQREIEQIRSLGWAQIGLTALPPQEGAGNPPNDPTPAAPRNPNYYVNGSNLLIKTRFNDSASPNVPGTPAAGEPLVTGGAVDPGPASFVLGPTRGRVHRYVTETSDCVAGQDCDESSPARRITVAVVLDLGGGGPTKPIWLSTIVTDPNARPPGVDDPDANPGSGTEISAQPFFLYDTPCSQGARQPIAAGHPTRDTARTNASCSASSPSQPDLMMADATPFALDPPLFDYSNDLARSSPAGGLVLKKHDPGCPAAYSAADAATRKWTIHKWVTPPFAKVFESSDEEGHTAFSFWTQSVDGHPGDGQLCFRLSRMATTNAIADIGSYIYDQAEWPTTPTELTFGFSHPDFRLQIGERLVVTVSLKSTSDSDIALLYDHPNHQSFITTRTKTPLTN